jgi:hypothetical protein
MQVIDRISIGLRRPGLGVKAFFKGSQSPRIHG